VTRSRPSYVLLGAAVQHGVNVSLAPVRHDISRCFSVKQQTRHQLVITFDNINTLVSDWQFLSIRAVPARQGEGSSVVWRAQASTNVCQTPTLSDII